MAISVGSQQQTQAYTAAQEKDAAAVADHVRHVHAWWFACLPDAEAAIAEYTGRDTVGAAHACGGIMRSAITAWPRRTRRARRGRPAKRDPPPMESGYRLEVAVEALTHAAEDNGWTVLATTVAAEVCPVWIDEYEAVQLAGVQPHHLLGCDALGLDSS